LQGFWHQVLINKRCVETSSQANVDNISSGSDRQHSASQQRILCSTA
jgi:hypothetical protein